MSDDDRPPLIETDLPDLTPHFRREPGVLKQPERFCEACNGQLWEHEYDLVCANCHAVAGSTGGSDDETASRPEPTNKSWPTYNGTEKPVLYGAFIHAHEWGGDQSDPESFYD